MSARSSLYFSFCSQTRNASQRGTSYTELIIIMPLMMLFLFGLAWAGRMFSQMIPFSKIAYETVRVGGDATALYGVSAMQYRFDQLYNSTYNSNNDLKMNSASVDASTSYSGGQVTLKSVGDAQSANGGYLPTQFKMNYVTQVLESHADTAGLTGTDNADCGYYDCNGHCNPEPLTAACPVTPPANEQGQSGGGGGGYHCFAAGTLISMADGSSKPIEMINVGDQVKAFDFQGLTIVSANVSKAFSAMRSSYYVLNQTIKVSSDHPFYVQGRWVNTHDLKIGDKLLGENGAEVDVISKVLVPEEIQVYNMTVDGVHNYFAGGVLVHNKSGNGPDVNIGSGAPAMK